MNDTINISANNPVYIKQNPYVGEDGIYYPYHEYVSEGYISEYRCVLTKDMFVEAYNKWIKGEQKNKDLKR